MFDSGSQKQKPEQINMLNDHPPPDLLFIFQGFCFTAPELVSCCELDTGMMLCQRGAQNLISSPSFVEDIQICIKLNKSLFDFRAGGDLDWGWGGIGISGTRIRDCKIIENPSLCKQHNIYFLFILYEIKKWFNLFLLLANGSKHKTWSNCNIHISFL